MKAHLDHLAVFGGTPAFENALHVGRPNIGNRRRFQERLDDVLDRRWLTNDGRYAREFEERLARVLGVPHAIAMCNGTIALEIAIRALELKGEVILPSFTFVATAHALQWQEITPVFCDIDPATHCLDPARVESMITPRTTGIIGVHVWGRPCDVEALAGLARQYRLRLLFDAAHAVGCSHRGRAIGGFGDAEVFSFHATKFVNALEGGAIATNDDDLARRIRLMKNFGFTDYDTTDFIGTNGKMNEVSAAMGLTSLESMDDFIAVNQRNYRQYRKELSEIPGVALAAYDETDRCNYQYVVLEIDQSATGISRDDLYAVLHAERVLARRYFHPGCHRLVPYKLYFPHAGLLLPQTERLTERTLCLPTGTGVDEEQVALVCHILRLAVENGPEVTRRIGMHPGAQR